MSPAEKLDLYKKLQDLIDIQHGDTFNWLERGEILGPHATSLLQDHLPGGDPLVVFDPTGSARANFIQPKFTFWNNVDRQGRIWYVGGYRNPLNTVYHFGQLAVPAAAKTSTWLAPAATLVVPPPKHHIMPRTAETRVSATSSYGRLGGECSWRYSSGSTAGLVYPNQRGGLEQWSATSGWQDLNLNSCWDSSKPPPASPLGADHVLRLLPQTSLQEPAKQGATTLTINGVDDADPQLHADTTPWFKAGQKIVIDPGAKDEQIVMVRATHLTAHASTLTLSQPLQHACLGGVMVSLAPAR